MKTKLINLKPEHQEFLLEILGKALNNVQLSLESKVLAAEIVKAVKGRNATGRKGKSDAQD